jgi:hypothetical protein
MTWNAMRTSNRCDVWNEARGMVIWSGVRHEALVGDRTAWPYCPWGRQDAKLEMKHRFAVWSIGS